MLFVLLDLILQCTYDTYFIEACVASIFGVPITIALVLSVLDIQFSLGNTLIQVMFASRDDTTISFGHLLYGIFGKSHLVRSLTIYMSLSTWPSCLSEPTISTWIVINALRNVSNSLAPTIISMLILCAVNADMVVFRPFDASVDLRYRIFITDLDLILNDTVTRKTWTFKNIKYTPIC